MGKAAPVLTPQAVADSGKKLLYRLIDLKASLSVGDYSTPQEAWEIVKTRKGKMLLWEYKPFVIADKFIGWVPTQMPLRYYSPKEKALFKIKTWWTKMKDWVEAK